MKKQTLALLVLFSFIPIRAQDAMKVNQATDNVDFAMSNLHKLTFEGDQFSIHLKDGTTFPYSLHALSMLTFGNSDSTNLNLQRQPSAENIGIFPNPISDYLNIKSTSNQKMRIQIIDLKGIKVYTSESKRDNKRIDVSHLSSGIYLLQLTQNGSTTTKIFIKN